MTPEVGSQPPDDTLDSATQNLPDEVLLRTYLALHTRRGRQLVQPGCSGICYVAARQILCKHNTAMSTWRTAIGEVDALLVTNLVNARWRKEIGVSLRVRMIRRA